MDCSSVGTVVSRFSRKIAVRVGLGAVLTLGASIGVFAFIQQSPNELSMIPANVTGLGSVDFGWVWTNSATIRQQPKIADALSKIESQSGISIHSDVVPWLGRIEVANLSVTQDEPKVAFFAEIRDMSAYASFMLKLQTLAGDKSPVQVQTSTVDGHTVLVVSPKGQSSPSLSLTVQKGWLVGAYGAGTLDDIFAVWDGRKPNLLSNVAFTSVIKKLYVDSSPLWAVGNPKQIMERMSPDAKKISVSPYDDIVGAALIDKGNTLDIKSVSYALNDTTRLAMKRAVYGLDPINASSLRMVPNQASAALVFSNPAHWIDVTVDELKHAMPSGAPPQMMFIDSMLQQYRPLYAPLTGDLTLTGIYSQNSGGVVLSIGTTSPAAAKGVAVRVVQLISPMIPSIKRTGNEWSIPNSPSYTHPLVSPAMRTVGKYIQFASSPGWLNSPEGHSSLTVPADAIGSIGIAVVSFKKVNTLLNIAQAGADEGAKKISTLLEQNNLQDATLSSWSSIDPSGQTETGTVRLSSFDWKSTFNQLGALIISMPPPPVTTPATPPAVPVPPAPTTPAPVAPAPVPLAQ
jgi:hypothetical protein